MNHVTISPSRNILIVDDDQCARESLAQWFRDARWTVRTADRCDKAFALAAAVTPSCLIVEQKLCDGTGFDLLSRIRARNPEVAAIVLTRYPSIAAAVHAMRTGFQDYLTKPIEARKVAALFGAGASLAAEQNAANDVFDSDDEPASLARVEWEHIHTVLLDCRGNISEAARVLGLHRRSLQRKLRRFAPPLESAGRAR